MKPFLQCQKCGTPYYPSEINYTFPIIPHLLKRIAPSEKVPAGECNLCGALVYEMRGFYESPEHVKFICGADVLICLNDCGKLELLTTVAGGTCMDDLHTEVIDESSVDAVLGDEWTYSQLLDGLSDGTLILGNSGKIRVSCKTKLSGD
jgi:hypothetical protein